MEKTSNPTSEDELNRALRITASQTSALCNGGAVLLYSHIDSDPETGRLRAAAGFGSADEARQMAADCEKLVRDAINTGETQRGGADEIGRASCRERV